MVCFSRMKDSSWLPVISVVVVVTIVDFVGIKGSDFIFVLSVLIFALRLIFLCFELKELTFVFTWFSTVVARWFVDLTSFEVLAHRLTFSLSPHDLLLYPTTIIPFKFVWESVQMLCSLSGPSYFFHKLLAFLEFMKYSTLAWTAHRHVFLPFSEGNPGSVVDFFVRLQRISTHDGLKGCMWSSFSSSFCILRFVWKWTLSKWNVSDSPLKSAPFLRVT